MVDLCSLLRSRSSASSHRVQSAAITVLGLSLDHYRPATLADGNTTLMTVYKAVIAWDGVGRSIDVLKAEGLPLLGTSLLEGHEVLIEFKDGGRVLITRLP